MTENNTVFREPFDLRLEIDGTHFYSEHFERVPYVFDNTVYLFKGDAFGVTLIQRDSGTCGAQFESASEKADVFFTFDQRTDDKGNRMMVLKIENRMCQTLMVAALMTVPGQKDILKTTVPPLRPKMTRYESWPHAIVQLAMHGFKFQPGE